MSLPVQLHHAVMQGLRGSDKTGVPRTTGHGSISSPSATSGTGTPSQSDCLGAVQLLDLRPLRFSRTAHRSNPQPREPMQVAHHRAGTVERDVHSLGGQVQPLPAFDVVVLDHVPAGVLYVLPVQPHHAVVQGLRVRQHRRAQVHRRAGGGSGAHLLGGRSVWSVAVAAAVLGLYPEEVLDSIGQIGLVGRRIGGTSRLCPNGSCRSPCRPPSTRCGISSRARCRCRRAAPRTG